MTLEHRSELHRSTYTCLPPLPLKKKKKSFIVFIWERAPQAVKKICLAAVGKLR